MENKSIPHDATGVTSSTPSKAEAKMVTAPAPGENPALTLSDYQELYDIPKSTLHTWTQNGELPCEKDEAGHRTKRVRLAVFRAFLLSAKAGPHRNKAVLPPGDRPSARPAITKPIPSQTTPPAPPTSDGPTTTTAAVIIEPTTTHAVEPPCPPPLLVGNNTQAVPAAPLPPSSPAPLSPAVPAPAVTTNEILAHASDAAPLVKSVPLDAIVFDETTQIREKLNFVEVGHYADLMRQGTKFPPVDLFADGKGGYYIGDGHHRLKAAKLAERHEFHATIHKGGLMDARRFALTANHGHGLRYTNPDKLRAIKFALELHPDWSNPQIAKVCQVSEANVRKHRSSFVKNEAGKRIGADGKVYTVGKSGGEKKASSKKRKDALGDAKYHARQLPDDLRETFIRWFVTRYPECGTGLAKG